MQVSPFTHNFLLLFAGPLIWAMHFLAIYGFTGIICARPSVYASWFGIGIVTWGIIAAGIVAIVMIAAVYLVVKPRDAAPDNHAFIRWMSVTLSLLSVVAIIWETLTVFLIPACL
jgi:hypothetical protein